MLRLHTNRGGEFISKVWREYAAEHQIWLATTEADNPQSNGRRKSIIGSFKRATRSRLLEAGLPARYWPLAFVHAGESLLSRQLNQVGYPSKPLIPFKRFMSRRGDGKQAQVELAIGVHGLFKGRLLRPQGMLLVAM